MLAYFDGAGFAGLSILEITRYMRTQAWILITNDYSCDRDSNGFGSVKA
jgi:hypothetical protein